MIAVFFALLMVLKVPQAHGSPTDYLQDQAYENAVDYPLLATEQLLDKMNNAAALQSIAQKLLKTNLNIQLADIESEFSLDFDGCEGIINDETKTQLSRFLEGRLRSGKFTLSCGQVSCPDTATSQSGVTYTRWGHNACPSVDNTTMLYTGLVAGAFYRQRGGGANSLCLPQHPDYNRVKTNLRRFFSTIYGTEYRFPTAGSHNHDVPCAVCYASTRVAKVMIPGKTSCPPDWTQEYFGYIMSERNRRNRSRNQYICVDKEQVSAGGSRRGIQGNALYNVRAKCYGSLPCPPYNPRKALTCTVCTK